MKKLIFTLMLIFVISGAGCREETEPSVAGLEQKADMLKESTQDRMVRFASEDLAKLLNVNKNEITVKDVKKKTWSDGSLGYPEEGHFYTQALVDGYSIVLSYKGGDYEYHTNTQSFVKLDPKLKKQLEIQGRF